MALQDLATSVRDLLKEVDGLDKVVDRPGGAATWATDPRPSRNYWEIDLRDAREEAAGIGTCAFRYTTVQIQGYLPFSFDRPNSTATWRPLVDAVLTQLREHMSLAQTVNDAGFPQLVTNDRIVFSGGGSSPEILCHHAVIEVRVRQYLDYSTA
jgi:hypothetical protein